jgi:hypothetical protein
MRIVAAGTIVFDDTVARANPRELTVYTGTWCGRDFYGDSTRI